MNRIAHNLTSFLNLGIVSLLLSLLLYDRFEFRGRETLITAVIYTILVLLVLIVIMSIFQIVLFFIRAHGSMVVGESREYTCTFVGSDGTLADTVRYTVRNLSFSPQRTLFTDSEGFSQQADYRPKYFFESRTKLPKGQIGIVGQSEPIPLTEYRDYSSGRSIYQGMWGITLDPPLLPFESVTFVRHSIDTAADKRAFSDDGTEFIFRVRIPFRLLSIVIHAPPGYALQRVSSVIDSQAGKPIRVPRPKGILDLHNSTTVAWRVKYPNPGLRYKVRFALKALGST